MPGRWRQPGEKVDRKDKPKFQGRAPELPQAFYEGAAEFSHGGRQYRVESTGSKLTLFSKQGDEWNEEGQADSRARMVDLLTAQTGKYRWDTNTYRGNLPQSVETLISGQRSEE